MKDISATHEKTVFFGGTVVIVNDGEERKCSTENSGTHLLISQEFGKNTDRITRINGISKIFVHRIILNYEDCFPKRASKVPAFSFFNKW